MPVIRKQTYSMLIATSEAVAPIDSTTYYLGKPVLDWGTSNVYCKMIIPKTGIITNISMLCHSDAAGTAEAWTMNFRNITTATTYPIATVSSDSSDREWKNANLNIPVTAGDLWCIVTTTPAWATNPVFISGVGYVLVSY